MKPLTGLTVVDFSKVLAGPLWRKFCALACLTAIADDPRFRTNADRVANRTATVGLVQSMIGTRTSDEWMRLLGEVGIPASPINSFADASGHPHTDLSGMILEMSHARYGSLKSVAQPIRFNGARNTPASPPPLHGERTAAILTGLGHTPDAVEKLRAHKAVFIP